MRIVSDICLVLAIMLCDENLFQGEWRLYAIMALLVVALSDDVFDKNKKLEK
jgi:hypothetical protein